MADRARDSQSRASFWGARRRETIPVLADIASKLPIPSGEGSDSATIINVAIE